jgi:hypothetical protein
MTILDVYLLIQCHQQWFRASSDNVTLFIVSMWETCVPYVEHAPFQGGPTRSIHGLILGSQLLITLKKYVFLMNKGRRVLYGYFSQVAHFS